MSIKSNRTSQPQTPWAVQYNMPNRQDGASETSSVFSDVKSMKSRRSIAASIRSRQVEPISAKEGLTEDKVSKIAAQPRDHDGLANADQGATPAAVNSPPENGIIDQEAEDEKAELYDEINSLYNMENPKGDETDDRKSTSQFSQ